MRWISRCDGTRGKDIRVEVMKRFDVVGWRRTATEGKKGGREVRELHLFDALCSVKISDLERLRRHMYSAENGNRAVLLRAEYFSHSAVQQRKEDLTDAS